MDNVTSYRGNTLSQITDEHSEEIRSEAEDLLDDTEQTIEALTEAKETLEDFLDDELTVGEYLEELDRLNGEYTAPLVNGV